MDDTAVTAHAQDEDLELYVRGRLELPRVSLLETHLPECQPCRENLARCIGLQLSLHPVGTGKTKQDKDQRSEPRFDTGDDAIIQKLNPLSLDRQVVKIVDISRNGLGILASESLLPGTIVQIRIKTDVELGEVRYSLPSGDGRYRIGLRLGEP